MTMRSAARCRAALAAALVIFALAVPPAARAAGELTLDGETIADAATYAAAKKEGKVTLYSTFILTSMKAVMAKFQADTGIAAEDVRLTTAQMYDRVLAESTAGKLAADYVDLTDVTLVMQLAQKGVLRAYKVTDFAAIPAVLRDGDGKWYAVMRSLMAIGVNTAVVPAADQPVKWSDLLAPRFKGKVGFMTIDSGGTAFSQFFFLHQRFGAGYWQQLAAQQGRIYPTSSPLATDLARGEVSVAVGPIDALLDDVRSGAPVKIVAPAEGVPGYTISGGITASAPHPHAAEVFMDWITSKRGLAAVAASGAYGARNNAPAPANPDAAFPPAEAVYNIRPADYLANRDALTREWHAVFGNR
jgi:iron(III) transport system substrate-binding protein